MTLAEIVQMRKDIEAYKSAKAPIIKQVHEIEQQRADGVIFPWDAEAKITELYKDLHDTPERRKYSVMMTQVQSDKVFEKEFRKAHLAIWFGI